MDILNATNAKNYDHIMQRVEKRIKNAKSI